MYIRSEQAREKAGPMIPRAHQGLNQKWPLVCGIPQLTIYHFLLPKRCQRE